MVIPNNESPLKFFLLVFTTSIPLWIIGYLTHLQLMPGLPVSSLMVLCPMTAAGILLIREGSVRSAGMLFNRAFDCKRISNKVWYIPIILIFPGIAFLAYGLMYLSHVPLPALEFPVFPALIMFVVFFIAAVGEELGWTGYALDLMQNRYNALQAGIFLGLIWAVWHIVPFLQVDRSPIWILWQCLTLISQRVLLVWIYNKTGKSVFAVALSHTMSNVSWQLFPSQGSHYDPQITGLITTLVAAMVIVVWKSRRN